jgi:isoquinoline 1-oxidoreductase beta subunit
LSEKATLDPGPVAQNIGNAGEAMASAVTKVEAAYELPFLAHATDGADELHGACPQGRL